MAIDCAPSRQPLAAIVGESLASRTTAERTRAGSPALSLVACSRRHPGFRHRMTELTLCARTAQRVSPAIPLGPRPAVRALFPFALDAEGV